MDNKKKQLDEETDILERKLIDLLQRYEPLKLMRTIKPLKGTLIIEGMIIDVDDKYAFVEYIEDNTLSQGNTRTDGNPDNKTIQSYFVPLNILTYQKEVTLGDLKTKVGNRNWEFPFRLIFPQNLEARLEVGKPFETKSFSRLTEMNRPKFIQYLERPSYFHD